MVPLFFPSIPHAGQLSRLARSLKLRKGVGDRAEKTSNDGLPAVTAASVQRFRRVTQQDITIEPRYDLDSLQGLQIPNDACYSSQNPEFSTASRHLRAGWVGKQAPITWTILPQVVRAKLPVEFLSGTTDQSFPQGHGGVREEVTCGCIIRTVEDYVVRF